MVTTETPYGERGLGLVAAPPNMRQAIYRLTPAGETPAIDWGASPSLRAWLDDHVFDQGHIGSCVACATMMAVHILRTMRGLHDDRKLNINWSYFWGRARCGLLDPNDQRTWFDSGMWAYGALDVALPGYPREELDPYVQDALRRPPDDVLSPDIANNDDVLSHRGIFVDDFGGLAGGVILGLQQMMPILVGMYWRGEYNNPDAQGKLADISAVGSPGAHEIMVYKRIPEGVIGRDWYAVARNSWGRQFTQGRTFPDAEMIPGDFLIPGSLFSNGTVIDVRAASSEYAVQPDPVDDETDTGEPVNWEARAQLMHDNAHWGCNPYIKTRDDLNAAGYGPDTPEMREALAALGGAETIRNTVTHYFNGGV